METRELKSILGRSIDIEKIERIECFDISHHSGKDPTASMVTFVNGESDKRLYRHFKVYQNSPKSDTDSMEEIGKRRKKNLPKWGRPDLMIVDGGKGQVTSFIKGLNDNSLPVIGLSKSHEILVIPKLVEQKIVWSEHRLKKGHAKNLVVRIRDEAHRFARRLHHKQFKKEMQEI